MYKLNVKEDILFHTCMTVLALFMKLVRCVIRDLRK